MPAIIWKLAGILSVLLLLAASVRAEESLAKSADRWELVWSDEFDEDGLPDLQKWTYEVGFKRNSELQYYTKVRQENARVENGHLIIEARKERWKNADYGIPSRNWPGKLHKPFAQYTSASLTTERLASWTFGRFEVRAKLPKGRGVWPAIWMLGDNFHKVGWPRCGELDIMEFVGFQPRTIHANVHCQKYNHANDTAKGLKIEIDNPSDAFHVYAMEWTTERIDFFVDDQKYFSFENEGGGEAAWPFDQPQYLLLNLAIGGSWGGQQGIDDAIFPQQYLVDYVRVYQQRNEAAE